jgi:putative intracellular protease/amidase
MRTNDMALLFALTALPALMATTSYTGENQMMTSTKSTAKTALKPVLMVMTSHTQKGSTGQKTGFYLPELTHPLAAFEEAGIATVFASVQGGAAPVDGVDLKDPVNAKYWDDKNFRSRIEHTLKISEVKAADYSAIFFVGGHGTMWDFADNAAIQAVTADVYDNGGVVGAVCHGPAALVNVKLKNGRYLVDGKSVSAFTDDEERAVKLENVVPFLLASTLQARGAKHEAAANWQKKVVVSERLVTGQNPASAAGVGEAMRTLLLQAQ